MTAQLTYQELAALMKSGAGVSVDPSQMESSPGSAFDEYGLDSLGLLGIVEPSVGALHARRIAQTERRNTNVSAFQTQLFQQRRLRARRSRRDAAAGYAAWRARLAGRRGCYGWRIGARGGCSSCAWPRMHHE